VTPGYTQPLYILAFDHRTSFQVKLFGVEGTPTPDELERIHEAKVAGRDRTCVASATAPAARAPRQP